MQEIEDWCPLELPGVASRLCNSFPIAIVARTNAKKYINSIGMRLRLTPNLIQVVASRILKKSKRVVVELISQRYGLEKEGGSCNLPDLKATVVGAEQVRLFVLLVLPTLH